MVDVSRNVVAILLVLVIVVSGFGTISALSHRQPAVAVASNAGQIGLSVVHSSEGSVGLAIEGHNG